MCRHIVKIDETKVLAFGFDGPCGGYFATLYDKSKKENNQIVDEVGMFPGVGHYDILNFFHKHNIVEVVKQKFPTEYDHILLDIPC